MTFKEWKAMTNGLASSSTPPINNYLDTSGKLNTEAIFGDIEYPTSNTTATIGPTAGGSGFAESLAKNLDPATLDQFSKAYMSGDMDRIAEVIGNNQEAFGNVDFSGFSESGLGTGGTGGGLSNMDMLRGGLGIGQLGLGVLSYLDQSKTADAQRKLMKQQMDQNKFVINQAKQRQNDIAKTFGGGGLAASTASK